MLTINDFKSRYRQLDDRERRLFLRVLASDGQMSWEGLLEEEGDEEHLNTLQALQLAFVIEDEQGGKVVHVPHEYLFMEDVPPQGETDLVSGLRCYSADGIKRINTFLGCSGSTNKAGRSSDIYFHVLENARELFAELSEEEGAIFESVLFQGGLMSCNTFLERFGDRSKDPYLFHWGTRTDDMVGAGYGARGREPYSTLFRSCLLTPYMAEPITSSYGYMHSVVVPDEVMDRVGWEVIDPLVEEMEEMNEKILSSTGPDRRFQGCEWSFLDEIKRMLVYLSAETVRLKKDNTIWKRDTERLLEGLERPVDYINHLIDFLLKNDFLEIHDRDLRTGPLARMFLDGEGEPYIRALRSTLTGSPGDGHDTGNGSGETGRPGGDVMTDLYFGPNLRPDIYPSLKLLERFGDDGILYIFFLGIQLISHRRYLPGRTEGGEDRPPTHSFRKSMDRLHQNPIWDDRTIIDLFVHGIIEVSQLSMDEVLSIHDQFRDDLIRMGLSLISEDGEVDPDPDHITLPNECRGCDLRERCMEALDNLDDRSNGDADPLPPSEGSDLDDHDAHTISKETCNIYGPIIRLTSFGRSLVQGEGFTPEITGPGRDSEVRGDGVIVKPDMEIVASRETPFPVLEKIGLFSRIISLDRAFIFRIDRDSIVDGVETGMQPDHMLEILEEHSQNPLPQNVSALFDEVEGKKGEIEIGECYGYIRTRDHSRTVEILRIKPLSKYIGGTLGDDIILIREPGAIKKVYDILRKRRYVPEIIEMATDDEDDEPW